MVIAYLQRSWVTWHTSHPGKACDQSEINRRARAPLYRSFLSNGHTLEFNDPEGPRGIEVAIVLLSGIKPLDKPAVLKLFHEACIHEGFRRVIFRARVAHRDLIQNETNAADRGMRNPLQLRRIEIDGGGKNCRILDACILARDLHR